MSTNKKCLICDQEATLLMNDSILGKYNVNYYLCPSCKCIFTEEPYWLEEAYSNVIAPTDTGIMARNISICDELMFIFNNYFDTNIKVVDYGGGYGILTRMLRDKGVDAYWHDKYSENLLSRGFEYDDKQHVDVILAFEVLEHLPNPLETIKEIMSKTDCFIFSTLLLETLDHKTNKEWWYFAPEGGQHIFLSSETTLQKIAKLLGYQYDCINGLHIIHNKKKFETIQHPGKINKLLLKASAKFNGPVAEPSRFKSKTWDDHLYMKSKFNKKASK